MAGNAREIATTTEDVYSLLSVDQIKKHDSVDDKEDNFEAWTFPFQMMTHHLGWGNLIDERIRQNIPSLPNPLWRITSCHEQNPLLFQRLQDKALTIVIGVGIENGYEALRLIFREFKLREDDNYHGMPITINQPTWWTI